MGKVTGKILMLLSLLPVAFLLYTLLNLGNLGISAFHPRVQVEFSIFVALLILGIALYLRTP
jgi:hypothetical protein